MSSLAQSIVHGKYATPQRGTEVSHLDSGSAGARNRRRTLTATRAMHAAFCTEPGKFVLRDVAQPTPCADEAVVQVHSCGVCGSDLHYFHGGFPPPPVCPGHEISGRVTAVGDAVRQIGIGERVAIEPLVVCRECPYCRSGDYQLCRKFCLVGTMRDGGFAEYVVMPAYALFPLPPAVDYEIGALTEPLAVAVHAVRLAKLGLGHRILVLGAGTIGLLSVAAARAAGAAEVWITARHPQQRAAAVALGAARVFAATDEVTAALEDDSIDVDVVIETVGGTADTLNEAVQLVRPGGTIAVLGVFTTIPPLNALSLVLKEVRLIGSLTYGRAGRRADFDLALGLLAAEPERFRQLITHRFRLAEITQAFETAGDKGSGSLKVSVQPS